jgi:hypothetical protein
MGLHRNSTEISGRMLKLAFVGLALGSITVWSAASVYRAYQRRETIKHIRAVAGPDEVGCGLASSCFEEQRVVLTPRGPQWLRSLMSEESCRNWVDSEVSVDLSWSSALDADVLRLRYLNELQRLDLTGTKVSDSCLAVVRELPGLEELHLGSRDITDLGIANLARLTRLRVLELDGVAITRDGLETLRTLPRLVDLRIYSQRLTDEGLAIVARMDQIEILGLSSAAITDAGLARLKQMPRLKKLHLRSVPQLTSQGLVDLQTARPGLCFVW